MDMTPNPVVSAQPTPPVDNSGKPVLPDLPVTPVEIGASVVDKEGSVKTRTATSRTQVGFAGVQIQDSEDAATASVILATSSINSVMSVFKSPMREVLYYVSKNRIFKTLSMVCLLIALFGGSIFVIFEVPDDPGVGLQDAIMLFVLVIFVFEIIVKTAVEKCRYLTSFFFYMDLLGTFSMLFEISFVFGSAGKLDTRDDSVNTLLLRAARASKIGARAGRFTKVVKVFNFIHRAKAEDAKVPYEARVLNAKLMTTLSSKVAMLTIALVIGVPLINTGRYPVDDLSLRTWARTLEVDYTHIYESLHSSNVVTDGKFEVTINALKDFYNDLWYHPYHLNGFSDKVIIDGIERHIPGEKIIQQGAPDRKDFIVQQEVSRCRVSRPGCEGGSRASILYDFSQSKKFESGMDIAMIVFVVAAMVVECADLSATLNRIVVRPVERMLGTVRMMAKVLAVTQPKMKEHFGLQQEITEDDIDEVTQKARSHTVSETELLETVFSKLAKLTAVFMQSSIVDEAEMTSLDYESKGVLLEIMNMDQVSTKVQSMRPIAENSEEDDYEPFVPNLQVEEEVIEGWQLDLLGMQRDVQHQVITYIFYDSQVGRLTGATWIDIDRFEGFLQAVRTNYLVNPYHNFIHACDVVAVVFRIMLRIRASEWVTDVDMCALLIAALCHDIGHGGKTNVYLIETGHELAVRYNDKSPLENMHAAKLFDLCKEPLINVFDRFNQDAYKQARKVCINTILHTDNALHFDMVQDVRKVYETTSDICDRQSRDGPVLKKDYTQEVLQKDTLLWLKLFLHLADISTPLKPFWISRQWATRVQDEFFAQGDEEKRLGLPVGMLNDRQKVNRAGSEHGFINFLVSPLIFGAVGLFPPLIELADQMHTNMVEWKALWVETGPSEDEVKKRADDIQKVKEKVEELRDRRPPSHRSKTGTSPQR